MATQRHSRPSIATLDAPAPPDSSLEANRSHSPVYAPAVPPAAAPTPAQTPAGTDRPSAVAPGFASLASQTPPHTPVALDDPAAPDHSASARGDRWRPSTVEPDAPPSRYR